MHAKNCSGQALVEGVAALALLVAITVGAVLLIVGTGTLMYYKLKVAYVANAAARYAANGRYWQGAQRPNYNPQDLTDRTRSLISTLLTNMGMGGNVQTPEVDLNNPDTVTVRLKVSALPIISGGILPGFVTIDEAASEPYPNDRPVCVVGMGFDNSGTTVGFYFPSYGVGAQPGWNFNPSAPRSFPGGIFPYYNVNNIPAAQFNGPLQSQASGGAWSGAWSP